MGRYIDALLYRDTYRYKFKLDRYIEYRDNFILVYRFKLSQYRAYIITI